MSATACRSASNNTSRHVLFEFRYVAELLLHRLGQLVIQRRAEGKGQVVNEITISSTAAATSALPTSTRSAVARPRVQPSANGVSHSTAGSS